MNSTAVQIEEADRQAVGVSGGGSEKFQRRLRICEVSIVHPWVNPRLTKEADFFTEEGHEVFVITASQDAFYHALDEEWLKTKKWQAYRLDLLKTHRSGRARWFRAALRTKLAHKLSKLFPRVLRFSEEANYRGYPWVLARALDYKADLYIAHTQAAIPIAARAARKHGAHFAFDCEDLNADALADGGTDPHHRRNILAVERAYLKDASFVCATSEPMAELLRERYQIKLPTVIYNVFPEADLAGIPRPSERPRHAGVRLAWIAATIGEGRGLEDAVRALALLPREFTLTIFGKFRNPEFERSLKGLIRELGVEARVEFSLIASPNQILERLSEFDIGLALDDGSCPNLSLTISNKFFCYVQAGLLLVCTDIPGQRSVYEKFPQLGIMFEPGDYAGMAAQLSTLANDPDRLRAARDTVWQIAKENFSWDIEKRKLLANVTRLK